MSISNNVGHDNASKDTFERNNLNDILNGYSEWKRTGKIEAFVKQNQDLNENLECPEQVWVLPPENLTIDRLDAFFYAPELQSIYKELNDRMEKGDLTLCRGRDLTLRKKLSQEEKKELRESGNSYQYIEISDVTKFGLITRYLTGLFDELPSRGAYRVRTGDLLFAINNSSRGTVVKVPKEFDGAICTSGFFVIVPKDDETSNLLWYALRSEYCRKQVYYLAQTASQPELKIDVWNNLFKIPVPEGKHKERAAQKAHDFFQHIDALTKVDEFSFA